MDRHGGGKRPEGESEGRYSRMPSRWSESPVETPQQMRQPVGYSRGGAGGHGGYSERHHPYRGGPPHDYSLGGARGSGFQPGPGGYNSGFSGGDDQEFHMGGGGMMWGNGNGGGRDGGFLGAGRREYPKNNDGSKITKLFIGSVPRTATEQEIRPLFEEHGHVIEVALIKDKRTGQQQGCCFVKYANSEDADRAIKFLHNQFTLSGGVGPIQVRYADGERERLGAVEHKLFVGSLNRQATVKEIEEIFSPYGCVEDVYIMRDESKQSRGCGFVKFSNRENATAAITALSGVFVMSGCEQPLIVRFADPKRPKPGESRGGLAFGGPGLGPRSQLLPSIPRSSPNVEDPMGGQFPPSSWNQISSESIASSKGGAVATSSMTASSPSVQPPPIGQQISPLQKPTMSAQHLPPTQLPHNLPTSAPYSQKPTLQSPMQQHEHIQNSYSGVSSSITQALPSQQLVGLGRQLPSSQHLLRQGISTTLQLPLKTPQVASSGITPQQLRTAAVSQLPQQSIQRSPSPLVLQLQAQPLPSNFQSSQQTFTHLQPQLHSMQPSNLSQQQSSLDIKQLPISSALVTAVSAAPHPSNSHSSSLQQLNSQPAEPLTCSWTEHTSPEGFNYYYNSVTKESKWEKPEDLSLFEKKQQQQKLAIQHLQSSQMQPQSQIQSIQQGSQIQPSQNQMQFRQHPQLQQLQPPSYQASGSLNNQNIQDLGYSRFQVVTSNADSSGIQKYNMQGSQSAQEWMWKNQTAGMRWVG